MSSITGKRGSTESPAGGGGGGVTEKKRARLELDHDHRLVATSEEDLDLGLLRMQNRRLTERLRIRRRAEDDLRTRLEQLEKKQLDGDTKLYVINRYWNQLNEDMRLILQRFDVGDQTTTAAASAASGPNAGSTSGSGADSGGGGNDHHSNEDSNESNSSHPGGHSNEETTSFVRRLANCDKEELDDMMRQRVLLSTRAVSKVITAFDRIVLRNEKLCQALKGSLLDDSKEENNNNNNNNDDNNDTDDDDHHHHDDSPTSPDDGQNSSRGGGNKPKPKSSSKEGTSTSSSSRPRTPAGTPSLDETVRSLNAELTRENRNLNILVTSLHEKIHVQGLKCAELADTVDARELANDELKSRIDELEMELNKSRTREKRMEEHFYDAREKLRDLQSNGGGGTSGSSASGGGGSSSSGGAGGDGGGGGRSGGGDGSANSSNLSSSSSNHCKVDDLKRDLEEQRELAQSRLAELEALNAEHKETLKAAEKYKLELQCIPETVIRESAEYKSLQSHFSVLYNDSVALKTQVDELRGQLATVTAAHLRQIETMESDELAVQKQLREEMMRLEEVNSGLKRTYDMLRIDHEQTQAANEQAGPINREMRHLITSLQTHTKQLKDENARTKKKLKEAQLESGRLRAIIEQHGLRVVHHLGLLLPDPKEAVKTEQNNSAVVGDTKLTQQQLKADPHHQGVPHQHQHPSSAHQHSSTEGAAASSNQSMAANLHSDSSNDGQLVMASEGEVKAVADHQQQQQAAAHHNSSSPASSPIKREQHQIKKESSSPLMPSSSAAQALEIELTVEPSELAEFFEQGPGGGGSIGSSGGGGSDSATLTANSSGSGGGSSAAAAAAAAALAAAEAKLADAERQLREVKSQLKKSTEERRELKLLLDGYKMADKDKRERAQLMMMEKKLRCEVEELRSQLKRHQEAERRGDRRKVADEEVARRVATFENAIAQLQKSVASSKQDEEALLSEMEVTGQAFEDMQEQNNRLMAQLREKDDANFKLMSDRIKATQIQKMLKDEHALLTEQVFALGNQLEAQVEVVRKLEEKERILLAQIASMEKEVALRTQGMESYKRKAVEATQQTNDLKLHLDKYVSQIRDAQSIVADKTSAWQNEMFKTKRLHEDLQSYKRKYERAKKFEMATTADEVLQEEIRELKEELTCPSCKTKRKDAVLNKCFHVFCYDCLKTRYETRQRKCPKCNQSFSANDFHRLYLA